MTRPVDAQRRTNLLTRAARAFGLSALREDPRRFGALLEMTIDANDEWFVPDERPPQDFSHEERRMLGRRLEDLIDEAVLLAAELYPGRRRDTALLSIAVHTERLMKRIWADPWGRSAYFMNALGRTGEAFTLFGSLNTVRTRVCFEEN